MFFPRSVPNRTHSPQRPLAGQPFPRRHVNGPMNIAPYAQQSQHSLTSLASKGAGGLSKTLTNVQQVLKVIESATPIVQQYGPMVKNLPAMYRMMKAFKEFDDQESNESAEVIQSAKKYNQTANKQKIQKQDNNSTQSVPKLFI